MRPGPSLTSLGRTPILTAGGGLATALLATERQARAGLRLVAERSAEGGSMKRSTRDQTRTLP